MVDFIVDRTYEDVKRWKVLQDKGWANMTSLERQEWLGEITPTPCATKGMYTYNDMNRVETAVENLVGRLIEKGYNFSNVVVKTDWSYTDGQPTVADMERYLGNILKLRNCFLVYPDTPEVPSIDQNLDYRLANDIEKILLDIDDIINKGSESWYFSGELFSGEV